MPETMSRDEVRAIATEQRAISDDVLRLTRGLSEDATLPVRVATLRKMCRIIGNYARAMESVCAPGSPLPERRHVPE